MARSYGWFFSPCKSSKRTKRKSRKSKKKKRGRKRKSVSRSRRYSRRRFGGYGNASLNRIMGDYRPPNKMNTYQQYTGMSPYQMGNHLDGILMHDRANFYRQGIPNDTMF